jgi:hypothetical protein
LAFAEAKFWESVEYQAPSWFEAYVKPYQIPSAGHLINGNVLCASVLVKYSVRVLFTSGRCCGDWGIMSIIYRIYTTGSV